MARIESWFNQDLKQAVKVHYLDGNIFSADNAGNMIGVNVFDNGSPASLSGSISGSVIRSDGGMVAIEGVLSNNKAYVVLPEAAYAIPGPISIIIKITSGTDITTLCAVVANVYTASTDTPVDPGQVIPSIEELIAAIEAAVATIPADYSELNSYVYGKDIIDNTQILDGKWVDMRNGLVKDWGSDPNPYCVTPMLSVAPNDVLVLAGGDAGGSQGAYYDANGNYISGFLSNTDTMTIVPDTSTIRYMRWCTLQANKATMAVKREKNQSGYKWAYDFNAGNNLITNWIDGKYVHYYDGTIANNSDFSVTDFIRVAPGSLLNVTGAAVPGSQVAFYNASKVFVSGIDSEGAATILVPNTSSIRYMRWCTAITNKSSASICHYQNDSGICIVVDAAGGGDYTSLTAAVAAASNGDIIYVKKGSYNNEAAKAWQKNISIIGEDKYQTIIGNGYNDYDRPPLEMCVGYIANLTLYQWDGGSTPGEWGAGYGLHIENNNMANGKFFAKDVVFKSDLAPGAGIGLRPGCWAYFEDCYFWSSQSQGIFYHDCATGAVGVQHIKFENCTFFTVFGEYSMRINSQKWDGSTVYNTFINCTVANSAGTPPKIDASHATQYTGSATGPIGDFYSLINFYKGKENYGNNVPELNFWNDGISINPKMGYLGQTTSVIADLNNALPNVIYTINCNSSSQLPAHSPSTGLLEFYVLTVTTSFISQNVTYIDRMQYAFDKLTFEPKFRREYIDSWASWSAIPSGAITVVDALNSTSTTDALSAKQGKVLNEKIPAVVNALNSTSTTSALSANQGKVLNDGKLNKSGGTMTGALTVQADFIGNKGYFAGTATSSTADANLFSNGALEIREAGRVASAQTSYKYAPRIGFHWSAKVAASLAMHTDGKFYFRKQNGTDPAPVVADFEPAKTNITLSIPSGWTISSNKSYKIGGFVYITCLLTANADVTGKTLDFGIVIPSGARPAIHHDFAAFNFSTNEQMWGVIDQDGRLGIYRTLTSALRKIQFSAMYPI